MSIYDVPVADTKFFPVDGDTMRQMKHDEQKNNDTRSPAKNSPDAVYSITQLGEQAMLHVSVSHADLVVHPIWCAPDECIAPDFCEIGDRRLHQHNIGSVMATEREGVEVTMVKFDDEPPQMIVADACLNLTQLEDLILLLGHARRELKYAGGEV